MKCNFCGEIIKRQGMFNEDICIDCENNEILRTLMEDKK